MGTLFQIALYAAGVIVLFFAAVGVLFLFALFLEWFWSRPSRKPLTPLETALTRVVRAHEPSSSRLPNDQARMCAGDNLFSHRWPWSHRNIRDNELEVKANASRLQ
jgi:hypothetical protein